MKTTDFHFRLPQGLVPDTPCELRGERRERARLAVLDRARRRVEHTRFDRLGAYLRPGDVLVVNDSLVVHDQLKGATSRGPLTLVLFGHHADGWHAMVRPSTRARRGLVVRVGGDKDTEAPLRAVLVRPTQNEMWLVRFEHEGSFHELLARHGRRDVPALRRLQRRMETYHNVYARVPGSLEIPSAGLHFTARHLERLERAGVSVVPVTLHIGLSELYVYRHISARNVEDHHVPAEWYRVKTDAARRINRARREGGRVVAVGTTVVRTLETAAREGRAGARVVAGRGWTDLYIHPGHRYRVVDAMLTNLHQPRSSHLMLVAAFAGKELTLDAYREIVRARYRFDLFGDSMLIV